MESIIDNKNLKTEGAKKQLWFRDKMPLVKLVNKQIKENLIFKDKVIAICMHIEPKTAFWIEGLLDGGAKHIYLVGCIGTTKKETAAYLSSLDNITVLGKEDDDFETHQKYLSMIMENKIDIFLDNGGSLILAHNKSNVNWNPIGANEETRSGKLYIEKNNVKANYPIIVIDDSPVKQLLENAIGVGQSVVDGFMRSTSLLVGGKNILVIGYGFCGSGVATKFKGLGANVLVFDRDPIKRLKALADGYIVDNFENLLKKAQVIITVTGSWDVINEKHIQYLKDGVILANSGHYGFEINVESLKKKAIEIVEVKKGIERLEIDKKSIFLLENATPLNLSAGDGNPIEIMDIGLSLQSLSAIRLLNDYNVKEKTLIKGLQKVPKDIDKHVSENMLDLLK
ncbi:MAG: adenosylhomocysteinase [Pleomorphochaeta sp.]